MLRRDRFFVLLGLCAPLGLAAEAQAFSITPDEVPKGPGGTEVYTITCAVSKDCPKGSVTVTVKVAGGLAREKKLEAVIDAFTEQQPFLGASEKAGGTIGVPGATAIITVKGTSGENDAFAMANGPGYGQTAFTGNLTGVGYDGVSPGEYVVAFGYDGLSISSDILYNSLPVKTLDGLAMATYDNLLAQLPTSLQSDLSLNPSTDAITFTFPDAATNPFASAAALDSGVTRSLTLAFVPEPATWTMMLIGLGGLGATMRRSRRTASVD